MLPGVFIWFCFLSQSRIQLELIIDVFVGALSVFSPHKECEKGASFGRKRFFLRNTIYRLITRKIRPFRDFFAI
jgi:hypothetical protein